MRNLKSVLVLSAACILALPGCPEDEDPVTKTEVCTNAVDDDGDGKADCDDSDCAAATNCQKTEICNNTIDDDADGQFDCDDPDCDAAANCQTTTENCNNGSDDDGDGKADCADSDCTTAANCQVVECTTNETACGNDCCANGTETCKNNVCVGNTVEGCLIPSTFGAVTVTGTVDTSNVPTLVGNLPATEGTDLIRLELFEGSGVFANGFVSGELTLPAADFDYATCGFCMRLWGDVDADGSTHAADYFMTGAGAVTLTSYEGTLVASVSNAQFTHVTYDSSWAITPHADGCTTNIGTAAFDGVFAGETGCDPLAPNCAEGQGCYVNAAQDGFECQTAGTVAVDGACTAPGQCVPGAECMDPGVCMEFCGTAADCTNTAATCTSIMTGLGVCEVVEICDNNTDDDGDTDVDCDDADCATEAACLGTACNPVTPTACAAGTEGCYYVSGAGFYCRPVGSIAVNQPCTGYGQCAAGLECIDDACREFCDPSATTSTCEATENCEAVTTSGTVGACFVFEVCDDTANADEDGDGAANCADSDCSTLPACQDIICATAVAETNATFTADNTSGTQGSTGTCAGKGKEVLRKISAGTSSQTGQLTIAVSTEFDAAVYARSTCNDVNSQLACADKVTGSAGNAKVETLVINNYVGGTEITLFLDAFSTGVGVFNVTVTFVPRVCGNGNLEAGETCDDIGTLTTPATPVAGDGCDLNCQIEANFACPTAGAACHAIVCGDGIVDAPEVCEPSTTTPDTDNCKADCTANPIEIAVDLVSPHAGEIAEGEVDWYKFVIAADSAVTAEITDGATTDCASGDLDSKLGIYNADGSHIATMDDGGTKYCSKLFFANLTAGTYLLKVEGYDEETAFDYVLNLTTGTAQACSAPADYGTPTFTNGHAEEYLFWGIIPIAMLSNFDINADPDRLDMIFNYAGPFENGLVAGSYPLTGDELDPNKCTVCLTITEQNGRTYIPTGGGVTLTTVTGTLEGTLTDVTFTEAVGGSVVPNACPTKITSAAFSTAITAPAK